MRALVVSIVALGTAIVVACGGGDGTATPGSPATQTVTPGVTTTAGTSTTATPTPTATAANTFQLFGSLTINGVPVAAGTAIEVRSGSIVCAAGSVVDLGGQPAYALDVPADCGAGGDWEMYVQGVSVGAVEQHAGQQDLAFTFGSPTATATASPLPTTTPTPTPSATQTATPGPDAYYGAAETQIRSLDFDPSGTPAAVELEPGRFFIAEKGICAGSADGKCQSVFFFLNDTYLGADSDSPWYAILDPVAEGDGFRLEYGNYLPDDPLCCPSGEPYQITFTWDGSSLVSSGIPPSELQSNFDPGVYFPDVQTYVGNTGMVPIGDPASTALPTGEFFIAQQSVCEGSATGDCQLIFFFVNGTFIATDTDEPNYGTISITANDDGTVTVVYPQFLPGDPNCCPSGEDTPVVFSWDGSSLNLSVPVPPLP